MDKQKLNIGLSIELMNNTTKEVNLGTFRSFMSNVKEAGKYLGEQIKGGGEGDWNNQTYTLNYENCSLDIEMISKLNSEKKIVKGFKFQ